MILGNGTCTYDLSSAKIQGVFSATKTRNTGSLVIPKKVHHPASRVLYATLCWVLTLCVGQIFPDRDDNGVKIFLNLGYFSRFCRSMRVNAYAVTKDG